MSIFDFNMQFADPPIYIYKLI